MKDLNEIIIDNDKELNNETINNNKPLTLKNINIILRNKYHKNNFLSQDLIDKIKFKSKDNLFSNDDETVIHLDETDDDIKYEQNFNIKDENDLQGINFYKNIIEQFFNSFKEIKWVNFWKNIFYNGVNYHNIKNKKGWGKKQHFIFIYYGGISNTHLDKKHCLNELKYLKNLIYYTLTYYKNENTHNNKKDLLITVLHLYFEPQYRLPLKYLSNWIYLPNFNYRNIDDIILGNFANKKIFCIKITLLLPEKITPDINTFLINFYTKVKLVHKNPPKVFVTLIN